MNGGGGEGAQARAPGALDELLGGLVDPEARGEEVGLAPQHALGHARGAAGVEDVEVVRAQVLGRPGLGGGQRGLVGDRAGEEGSARCRRRPGGAAAARAATAAPRARVGAKAPWYTIARAPAVEEDVPELLGHVAVVDVDRRRRGPWRRRACPRGTRCRCGGRGRRGRGATPTPRTSSSVPVDAEPGVAQHGGEPPAAVGDVGPGEPAVAPHEALPIGHDRRDGLVHRRQVQLLGHLHDGHRAARLRRR